MLKQCHSNKDDSEQTDKEKKEKEN